MNVYVAEYLAEMNRNIYKKLEDKDYSSSGPLEAHAFQNATIKPPIHPSKEKNYDEHGPIFGFGGVYGEDGKYIAASEQTAVNMRKRLSGFRDMEPGQKVPFADETVMYGNFFIKQWGHFLLDVIGRLWYALKNPSVKIVFTCYEGADLKIDGNYREFLSLLGIGADRIAVVNEPTRFRNVIVPDSSIVPGSHYTREYLDMMDAVIAGAGLPAVRKGRKIFCSRQMLGKTSLNEFGEETVESVFLQNGYQPVYMERLSLREQIAVLNSSEEIAMVCGSLSHNLLFVRNGNRACILNKTYRVNLHQFLINGVSASKAVFVDAFVSPLPVLYGYGPFIMRPTDQFLAFAAGNGMTASHIDQTVPLPLRMKYYVRYAKFYRRYFFKGKKIRETDNQELEPSFRTVRAAYSAYLKNARKT